MIGRWVIEEGFDPGVGTEFTLFPDPPAEKEGDAAAFAICVFVWWIDILILAYNGGVVT